MANVYRVYDDGAFVIERWTGTIEHAELLAHERDQQADESIRDGAVVLADCTDARFETTVDNMHELVEIVAPGGSLGRFRKIALLIADEALELAGAFSGQLDERGLPVVVFVSLDVACAWLGVNADATRARLDELAAG